MERKEPPAACSGMHNFEMKSKFQSNRESDRRNGLKLRGAQVFQDLEVTIIAILNQKSKFENA